MLGILKPRKEKRSNIYAVRSSFENLFDSDKKLQSSVLVDNMDVDPVVPKAKDVSSLVHHEKNTFNFEENGIDDEFKTGTILSTASGFSENFILESLASRNTIPEIAEFAQVPDSVQVPDPVEFQVPVHIPDPMEFQVPLKVQTPAEAPVSPIVEETIPEIISPIKKTEESINSSNSFNISSNATIDELSQKLDELFENSCSIFNKNHSNIDSIESIEKGFEDTIAEAKAEEANVEEFINLEEPAIEEIQPVEENEVQEIEEIQEVEKTTEEVQPIEENEVQEAEEVVAEEVQSAEENVIEEIENNEEISEEEVSPIEENVAEETAEATEESTEEENFIDEILQENLIEEENNFVEEASEESSEEEILVEDTKDADLEDNNVLLISEYDRRVFLPYTMNDIYEYLDRFPDKYSDEYDVIRKEFVLPIGYFNNFFYTARFREAFALYKDHEGKSTIESLIYAFKVMSIKNLHPAIIAACKSEKVLNDYIKHLKRDDVQNFKYFEINYKMNPVK